MKKKIITTLLLAGSFMLCCAAVNNINGKWTTNLKPGDGSEIAVTYTFKTDGDKFTGNLAFPSASFPVTDGKVTGDSISFKIDFHGKGIPNLGKVYADSIGLDILMNGKKYHNTLKRAN